MIHIHDGSHSMDGFHELTSSTVDEYHMLYKKEKTKVLKKTP
jgi:hypothetical protein